MHCSNSDCWNELTPEDIDSGYFHCSEECFQEDRNGTRVSTNPYDSLFDDPYAISEEDAEED